MRAFVLGLSWYIILYPLIESSPFDIKSEWEICCELATPTKYWPELVCGLPNNYSFTVWNSGIHRRRRGLLSQPCCPPYQAQQSAAPPSAGPMRIQYTPSAPSSLKKDHRTNKEQNIFALFLMKSRLFWAGKIYDCLAVIW